ncbi:hypothetical protein M8J77_003543 [Diaphorina citri]|nr:hypothetical protein M8J77_003543 [Diaphorina citri]
MNNSERSIVEFFSKSDGRSCGYCKSSSSSCSHGMWAHSLNVHDYQSLIDRGWRRSGHYCYKPVMNETCCPAYTIKCDAVQFKLTRSQKKLLKRFNHYLATGEKMKGPSTVKYHDRNVTSDMPTLPCIPSSKTIDPDHKMEGESTTSESSSSKLKQDTQESASSIGHKSHEPKTSSSQVTSSGEKVPSPNPLTSTAGSSKSKHLRIERRKQTLLSRGLSMDQVLSTMQASKLRRATREKTLEDFIHVKLPDNAKHRLELRLVQSSPPSSLFKKTFNLVVDVYRRYQMSVHGSAAAKCNSEQFTRFLCNSPLQIKLVGVKSSEFVRTTEQGLRLFTKYQTTVHKERADEADYDSFKGFLIDSPLKVCYLSPIVPMYISYLCDFAIMFADLAIMFADLAILFADLAIMFADLPIMFADFAILFADFAILFADFAIMFADFAIMFADLAILFADFAILFADFVIMFADFAIMFAGFAIMFADFAIFRDYASKASTGGHGYGSFHQQYWLDGRLIAVGVIDILPLCVSSVYFFYDPDYSWLSLGTLSSLREIEFTRSLHRSLPDLSSYYMGFYIHSCPKMRYKGNLRPSYLLCPEVYSWHLIQEARQLLDRSKYSRLNPDTEAEDKDCDVTLDQVLVLTGGKVMLYRQFKQMYDHDEEHPLVQEYASLVGQYCAYRMLLVQ